MEPPALAPPPPPPSAVLSSPLSSSSSSSSSSSASHLYLPISHPDSHAPTYAVLQLLGFSPNPNPNSLHFLCSSPSSTSSSFSSSLPMSPSLSPPSGGTKLHATSSSSNSDGQINRKVTSVKPAQMKKSGHPLSTASAAANASSPRSTSCRRGPNPNSGRGPVVTTISMTHTERDRVIHTDSAKFREVVHKLTGAGSRSEGSGGGGYSMQVSCSFASGPSGVWPGELGGEREAGEPGAETGRRPGLLERRRSRWAESKNGLDFKPSPPPPPPPPPPMTTLSLTLTPAPPAPLTLTPATATATLCCRQLPPLVPSPVTPLVSDFEKIFLPHTPSATTTTTTTTTLSSSIPHDFTLPHSVKTPLPPPQDLTLDHAPKATIQNDFPLGLRNTTITASINSAVHQDNAATIWPRNAVKSISMDFTHQDLGSFFHKAEHGDFVRTTSSCESAMIKPMGSNGQEGNCEDDAMDAAEARNDLFMHNKMTRVSSDMVAPKRRDHPTLLHLFPESPRDHH